MAALVAADVQARLAGHARLERLTRAGLVNATPVIQQCTKDMRVEAERNLATENDGKNPARRPNTLLSGTPALGGPRGGVARATRIVGLESRVRPRRYDILCFSSAIGEYMQHGTRPHTITATNPSGRWTRACRRWSGIRAVGGAGRTPSPTPHSRSPPAVSLPCSTTTRRRGPRWPW